MRCTVMRLTIANEELPSNVGFSFVAGLKVIAWHIRQCTKFAPFRHR